MPRIAAVAAAMGDGERESLDAGEAVTDPLGEHDVGGPAGGREPGEPQAGGIDVAVPGLGEQDDPELCQGGVNSGCGPARWASSWHTWPTATPARLAAARILKGLPPAQGRSQCQGPGRVTAEEFLARHLPVHGGS
jgi:hypothetical protein